MDSSSIFSRSRSTMSSTSRRERRARRSKSTIIIEEPDDVVAINIPIDLQKQLQCEPDVDLYPDKPWVCVPLDIILKDIEENEQESVFTPHKSSLELQDSEVIVAYEYFTEQPGGQHWVCVTNKGKRTIMDYLVLIFDEAVKKVESEFTKDPRPWQSLGSEEEVEELEFKNRRPLINCQFIGKKDHRFGTPNFTVVEAGSTRSTYLDVPVDPYHEHYNYISAKAIDEAIQAVVPEQEDGVQVREGIPVNASTQFNAEIEADEKQQLLEKLEIDYKAIRLLLKSSNTRIMETLQYNEAYDLCQDDYAALRSGSLIDLSEPSEYEQYMTFTCLKELRGNHVTSLAWHPNMAGIVAASYGKSLPNNFIKLDGDSDDEDYKVDYEATVEDPIDKAYQERLEYEAKDYRKWLIVGEELLVKDLKDETLKDETMEMEETRVIHDECDLAEETIDYVLRAKEIMRYELKLDSLESDFVYADPSKTGLEFNYEDYSYEPNPHLNLAKELKNLELDEKLGFALQVEGKPQGPPTIEASVTVELSQGDVEEESEPILPTDETFKIYSYNWNFGKGPLKQALRIHRQRHHNACRRKGLLPNFPRDQKYFPKLNLKVGQYYYRFGPYNRCELSYEEMAKKAATTIDRKFSTESLPAIIPKSIQHVKPSMTLKNERVGEMDSENLQEIYRDLVNTMTDRHKEKTEFTNIKTRYKLAEKKEYPAYLSSESIETEEENPYTRDGQKTEQILPRYHVLIWNIKDNTNPVLALSSPQELSYIQFCPHNGNYLVGSTIGGQLILWDLTGKLYLKSDNKKGENNVHEPSSHQKLKMNFKRKFLWYYKPRNLKILRWTAASSIDSFHKGRIVNISWLHPEQKFVDGHFEVLSQEDKVFTEQIITTGIDGEIKFWNLNTVGDKFELPPDKMFIDTSLCYRGVDGNTLDALDNVWEPIFTVKVVADGLHLPITSIIFDYVRTRYQLVEEELSSESGEPFFEFVREEELVPMNNFAVAGSCGGHLLTINWPSSENQEEEATISLSSLVHDGPIICVEQNRLHSNLILSVGGRVFALWYVYDLKTPLKWKKYQDVSLTYGAWSIWRPSVLRIARSDGVLEIWDFCKKSNRAKLEVLTTPGFITTILDPILPGEKPLLCIGDTLGSIKLYAIPDSLVGWEDDDPNIVKLFDKQINRKLYLIKWDKEYRAAKNIQPYEYVEETEEEIPLRKLKKITPGMYLDLLDDIHEKEKLARKSIKQEIDCRKTYFRELYRWYVRRRGYDCSWIEQKEKEIYQKEQEEIIGAIMEAKKLDMNQLAEEMKPILKYEQQMKYRERQIALMQAQADIIFKRNIEHIKILNPALVKLFTTDVEIELKETDLHKAEEELDLYFGEDSQIFESDLKLIVESFNIGAPVHYRDLEPFAVEFREWMNDRLLLSNKLTRWLRLEVQSRLKKDGLLCTEWFNSKHFYITKKYQERLRQIEELQTIYGPNYDPLWDVHYKVYKSKDRKFKSLQEKTDEYLKKALKEGEEGPLEDHEQSMVDDFLIHALFSARRTTYTTERKLFEDKHDKASTSSWIDLEQIVKGGDVLAMSFEFEHKRRQERLEQMKEISPTYSAEEIEAPSPEMATETLKPTTDTPLEESSENDVAEEETEIASDPDEDLPPILKMLRKKLPKTKYSLMYDRETEMKIFRRELQKFVGEMERKAEAEAEMERKHLPKDYGIGRALEEEEIEEQIEEERIEVEKGGVEEEYMEGEGEEELDFEDLEEEEGFEEGEPKKKKVIQEFHMEGDVWGAMGGELMGKPEYGESVPTDSASPSDITEQYFMSMSSSGSSSPLECEAEFGEFEDLLNFYKTQPEARRYPSVHEVSKIQDKQEAINKLKEMIRRNADGSFTFLLREEEPEILDLDYAKDLLLDKKTTLMEQDSSKQSLEEEEEFIDKEEAERLEEID